MDLGTPRNILFIWKDISKESIFDGGKGLKSKENKGLNQKKTKPKMLFVAEAEEDCIHGMIYV